MSKLHTAALRSLNFTQLRNGTNRVMRKCTRWAALTLLVTLTSGAAWAKAGLAFRGLVQTLNTGGGVTLSSPADIVVDSSGNVYIADTGNSQIVEITAQGVASVLTITGLSPALSSPAGITIDGSGNLYIADTGNNRVVEISSSGAGSVISTGSVTLSSPKGIVLDQSGDLFIADTGDSQIVEVPIGGSASVLSITGLSSPSTLNTPIGLAVDVVGDLYIADSVNNRIVKVASGGTAGTTLSIAGGLTLTAPSGVVVDSIGNVFIADTVNPCAAKLQPTHPSAPKLCTRTPGGVQSRIAEIDNAGNGSVLNTGAAALNGSQGVALDVFGTIYIADTGNSRVLFVDAPLVANITSADPTYSLNKTAVGFGHVQLGSASPVVLTLPFNIGATGSVPLGSVQVLTSGVQNLDFTAGVDTTCANQTAPVPGCSVEVLFLPTAPGLRTGAVVLYDTANPPNPILTVPLYGFSDSPVAALSPSNATLVSSGEVIDELPFQLALDGSGNIYVGNYVQSGTNPEVVKIPAGGGAASVVSTGTVALGSAITGVALDGAGNLFIADYYNEQIVVVTPGGVASVLAITGLSPTLGEPTELAFDGAGNLYIADYSPNSRIVKISSLSVAGSVSSGLGQVVNTGIYTFSDSSITGVGVGSNGAVYIAGRTSNNSQVVQVTAAGVASLLNPSGLTLSNPQGAFVDAMGNLYIEDSGNGRIVKITTAGVASAVAIQGLTSPSTLAAGYGIAADASGNLYIPDWTNNRIVFVNVSGASLTFASTNVGATSSDSPQTATVTNLGNQPLLFSTNPTFTANFSQPTGSSDQCLSSTSLTAGTVCDVSLQFTPQTVGSLNAGIVVTDNTLNVAASTQQVSVSGTGVSVGDATATAVSANPTNVTIGQTITVTAVVTDTATGHSSTVPTGNVTFIDTVGSISVSLNGGNPVTLSGGLAMLTGVALSTAGSHTITANYAGVSSSFLSSSNSATVAVTAGKATPTVTLASSAAVALLQSAVTFIATVSSSGGTPTGTVTFFDGSTSLGSDTLGQGAATFTTSSLAAGVHSITAQYGGDANFTTLTSSALSETIQDFSLTISSSGATSVTVGPGGLASYALVIGPTTGTTFPAALTLSVTGVPNGAISTITPETLPAGSGRSNVELTVQLPSQTASLGHSEMLALRFSPIMLGLLLPLAGKIRRPTGKGGRWILLSLLALASISIVGLTSCGGKNTGFLGNSQTSYTLTVTATSGSLSHSTTLNLTVQ